MRKVHALALLAAAALARLALADEARPPPDAPAPLRLRVGEVVDLCQTGTIICPAAGTICDDTAIVAIEATPAGVRLRGAAPGETMCSVAGSSGRGLRRVYRITVER